jgi:Integrase core domain
VATIVLFVCLRFVFLLVMRMCSWLRVSRREDSWKSAEILLLRHQLTVLSRQQPARPNMTWADRAWFAVLLSVVPHPRQAGLKLFVTPRSPIQAPRANAIMERWIGSCRREILDRALIWNQRHLLRVLREYETHPNEHRPHRSLAQAAPLKPLPEPMDNPDAARITRHDRIGGVIHEYTRAA